MNPEALRLLHRYDRLTERLEQSTIDRLNAALDGSYKTLERDFLRVYPQFRSQSLLAKQRALLVMDALRPLVNRVGAEPTNETALREGITEAWRMGDDLASEAYRALSRQEIQQLSDVPIEAVALQARDGAQRLVRHGAEFASRMSGVIEQGLVQGLGARKVASILQSEHGLTKTKAETVARTELLSALNSAAEQRYRDAGIEYVQFVCNSGKDTCVFCVARNMQVYRVGEIRPPIHPRCRCSTLPYQKRWQELGLIDERLAEQYRADRIADLAKEGKQPNHGVAPFERYGGATAASKPVWIPGE